VNRAEPITSRLFSCARSTPAGWLTTETEFRNSNLLPHPIASHFPVRARGMPAFHVAISFSDRPRPGSWDFNPACFLGGERRRRTLPGIDFRIMYVGQVGLLPFPCQSAEGLSRHSKQPFPLHPSAAKLKRSNGFHPGSRASIRRLNGGTMKSSRIVHSLIRNSRLVQSRINSIRRQSNWSALLRPVQAWLAATVLARNHRNDIERLLQAASN